MNRRGGWRYYEQFVKPKLYPTDNKVDELEALREDLPFIRKQGLTPLVHLPTLEARNAAADEVAPYLQQAFRGRAVLLDILKDIEKVSMAVGQESILEHGKYLEIEQIQRLLALAGDLIRQGLPSMPCDCGPNELDCPKCNGDLWIPAKLECHTTSSRAVK